MLYAICEWRNHVKFHFANPLSTERLFPLSIVLILCKILLRNIVRLKHQFSCLCGDTLSGNTHYSHLLTSCIHIFFKRMKQTLFLLHFLRYRICFFLPLSLSGRVHEIVFTKPAVTRDIFNVHSSQRSYWKDNELQNM